MRPSERARAVLQETSHVRVTLRGGGTMVGRVVGCSNDRIAIRTSSGRVHSVDLNDITCAEQLREVRR